MSTALAAAIISAGKYIGAGMATVGTVGAGIGIGIIFAGFLGAMARNPYLEDRLLRFVFLGFALTEAMGLLAVMLAFLILYG